MVVNSKNKVISSVEITAIGGDLGEDGNTYYNHSVTLELLPAKGLENVVNNIQLRMGYDACGYLNGHAYFVWDGKKLYYAFKDDEMSEAGLFANYSSVLYPADSGGINGKILSIMNHIEYDEDSEKETIHDSVVIQYGWKQNEGVFLEDTLFDNRRKL